MRKHRQKILIISGRSLLGTKIIELFQMFPNIEIPLTYFSKPIIGGVYIDITNNQQCTQMINHIDPDCVVLISAKTDVDYCETHKSDAYQTNVAGVRNVILASENRKLLFFSTDSVFDGLNGNYVEEDAPNPINYYSETKLQGELLTQCLENHLVLRICMLYGDTLDYPKFINWVIRTLNKNQTINVATDLYITPTLLDDIAHAVTVLVEKDVRGIVHVAGSSSHSCFDIANLVATIFGFNKKLINPVTATSLNRIAKRPQFSTLNIDKLTNLGVQMHSLEDGLKLVRRNIHL